MIINSDDNLSLDCLFRGSTTPKVWLEGAALTSGLLTSTPQSSYTDADCYRVSSVRLQWGTEDVLERRDAGGKVTCWGQNQDGSGTVKQEFNLDVQCM